MFFFLIYIYDRVNPTIHFLLPILLPRLSLDNAMFSLCPVLFSERIRFRFLRFRLGLKATPITNAIITPGKGGGGEMRST
jgi:hypothetical protein